MQKAYKIIFIFSAILAAVAFGLFALPDTNTAYACSGGHGGQCNYTCFDDSDCGTSGFVGELFCQGGDVYKNYTTYTCNNPGTKKSSCSNQTAAVLWCDCSSSQTCSGGQCIDQQITCHSNSDCGTSGFVGKLFCQGGDVYKNYKTYTCNNPGTAQSTCSNYTTATLWQTCLYNQQCSGGQCQNTCTPNYEQKCFGSALYWYNSCGDRGELIQNCIYGCQNNQCTQQSLNVQTNSATNIYNNQATLNGNLYSYTSGTAYVWFQWGTSTSYGYETSHQTHSHAGSFSQNISGLSTNTLYHFRAVAQSDFGNIVYGQDMTFSMGTSGNLITVNKTGRNLTSGSYSNWSNYISANPSDVLMFKIVLQAQSNQEVRNIVVRDILPYNLVYKDDLVVSGGYSNYYGDITSGINIGTLPAGQIITITYQAQVAPAQNFNYGTVNLTNSVSVSSSDSGYNPVQSNVTVSVNRVAVYGATTVSTGLTNNFLADSFFLPLMAALMGIWMLKSGMFVGIEKWFSSKKAGRMDYKATKELSDKIIEIKEREYFA